MTAHSSARAFRPGDYRPSSVTDGLDAAAVADMLEQRKMAVLAYLLPNGKKIGHEYCIGSLAGEFGESLKVNINGKRCVWKDFANPGMKGGGDLLDLWAAVRGITVAGAYAEALDWLGHGRAEKPVTRTKFRPADAVYDYTDAEGNVVSRVHRWEATAIEKKRFAAEALVNGSWEWHHPPAPRPLFGLSDLAARPDAPVVLCEGEKAATGARDHLPGYVCMSCSGGTAGVRHADYSPLKGHRCVLWADNDPEGKAAMEQAAEILLEAGAAEVKIVTLPDGLPAKWDLGDPLPAEWTGETVNKLISDAAVYSKPSPSTPRPSPSPANWPAPVGDDAKIGLAWDFVGTIAPHSEADPAALLLQFITAFGNACGRAPYFMAEADRHGANINVVIVGKTNAGRKGMSWGHVRQIICDADPTWTGRNLSGLSSGEGLIHAVRDRVEKPGEDGAQIKVVDDGVTDKRLLVQESEFSSVLKVAGREGNTLSDLIRLAWDRGNLQTMTRSSPCRATGAHVSIIGHITPEELVNLITETDQVNGFANRFMWSCSRRSKVLPEGGRPDSRAMAELTSKVAQALRWAQMAGEMRRDSSARAIWFREYERLTEDRPGLLGAITARAAPMVMRIAMIYALMDMSPVISAEHLKAALAVWKYAADSCAVIFGNRLGDPVADTILDALKANEAGMSRTEISHMFGRHQTAERITSALASLEARGLATYQAKRTSGRPIEWWTA